MGKRKHWIGRAGLCILCILLSRMPVLAEGSAKIMEKNTVEDGIVLYIKGQERDFENIVIQAGTQECAEVEKSTLTEAGQTIHTLVMLDNSKSIPKKARKRIYEIISNIVSDRADNEDIAIAVLNKEIEYLTDYTSERAQLKSALNRISYRNTKTFLTDILYDWMSEEYISREDDAYYRILVFADGTDNKPIGYTQEELYSLLKEYPVPIYTVGMKTKENNENLENLFAISRSSNAESFLLDEMENEDINAALNDELGIVKVTIRPDAALLDGNRKSVKLLFASGDALSTEVVMPQIVSMKGTQADSVSREIQETQAERTQPQKEEVEQKNDSGRKAIVIVVIIILAVAVIAAIVFLLTFFLARKKKNAGQDVQNTDIAKERDEHEPQEDRDADSSTELVGASSIHSQNDTIEVWDPGITYHIMLRDVNAAAKSVEFPLKDSVVIGRKSGLCDVVFAYDKTVSSRHCEIVVRDGRFFITDLKSSNGTYVNGRKMLSEAEIFSGNILKLGRLELQFDVR